MFSFICINERKMSNIYQISCYPHASWVIVAKLFITHPLSNNPMT